MKAKDLAEYLDTTVTIDLGYLGMERGKLISVNTFYNTVEVLIDAGYIRTVRANRITPE